MIGMVLDLLIYQMERVLEACCSQKENMLKCTEAAMEDFGGSNKCVASLKR